MKRTKMIAGMMSVMLLGTMALPVHAEDMTVKYREPNAYTISIPSSVDLSNGATSNKIEAKNVNLEPNKEIKITITSGVNTTGVIELSRENDTNTKAVTTISKTQGGIGIALNGEVATFKTDGEQQLYYSEIEASDGGQVKAGNYSGTLTFTVSAPEKN